MKGTQTEAERVAGGLGRFAKSRLAIQARTGIVSPNRFMDVKGGGIVSPWECGCAPRWGALYFLEIAAIDVRLCRTNFGEGAAAAALDAAQ
jgi:hypothetical protein